MAYSGATSILSSTNDLAIKLCRGYGSVKGLYLPTSRIRISDYRLRGSRSSPLSEDE